MFGPAQVSLFMGITWPMVPLQQGDREGIAGSKELKGECNGYNFLKCCDVSLQVYQKGTFLTIVF